MASGKKNYFRHSNSAFEDEKIQKCIQLLGYEGYAFYFILLELLAKQCENSFKNPITIHQQSLKIVWRKQTQSCRKVVTKLQESGLFVATFRESFIDFDIPNLSKYMGIYQNKIQPNAPKERKEKEKKRKEIKVKENKSSNDLSGEVDDLKKNRLQNSFSLDLVECFSDAELKEWLSNSGNNAKSQEVLWDTYHKDDLKTEIQSAYLWQLENKKRGAGSFLVTWLKRSGKKSFQEQQDELIKTTKKAMGL